MSEELKTYKWLVSSCLQKSIRRGRFDLAEPYIRFLWEHDRSYITYRFGTMLTEDVGIANFDVVNEYLNTKLAKKQIDSKGGCDFIIEVAKKACDSIKDRSSCDAAYMAGFYDLKLDNQESAKNLFIDSSADYIDRINAGWSILGGKKFKKENFNFFNSVTEPTTDDIERFVQVSEKIINPDLSPLLRNSYATQVENIFMGIPIMEQLYQKELLAGDTKIKVGTAIENMYVKEEEFTHHNTGLQLISCGVDGHTREGKSVYYNYLKTKNDFTKYLNENNIPFEKHIELFLHCMFRTEGHEVNKRIYYPTAVTVMRDCEQKVLNMKAGVPENTLQFSVIKNILLEAIPQMNKMKRESLNNSQANSYVKPKF